MRPPSTPPDDDRSSQAASSADSIDVAQSLRQAEETLLRLKARYAQIQADQQRQQELQYRLEDTRQGLRRDRTPALKAELKAIQQQLDEIEVALESQLFSWSGLKEVFWQAVRFGGLGIVLGWLLRSWAGG
ncbi:MAG TPA: hypothetical protein V6D10_03100 [Trichocoleus sp.]|jgi:predicted RNase H-like nuclease (RuvC/YqgF family)